MAENWKSPENTDREVISIPRMDILYQLNEYRLSNYLCDVVLVSGGREFPAHRVVLAASGGFFRGVFAANMKEHLERKVQLPQVDGQVMNDILGYIYTGKIEVTQENAQLLIVAADFLLIEELMRPVDKFLAHSVQNCSLSPQECACALEFAYHFKCFLLKKEMLKHFCKNFETFVTESQEIFLEMNAQTLEEIISCDGVVVSDEEVVFNAVIKWIRHKKEREKFLDQMLTHIRLCSVSEDFIHSVMLKDVGVASSPTAKYVHNGIKNTHALTTPNVPHPRDCLDAYTNAILIIPEDSELNSFSVMDGVWCYIPSEGVWYHIPTPPTYWSGFPTYVDGSVITTVNDIDADFVFIEKCDLHTNTWSVVVGGWNCPTWSYRKAYLKGLLYLIGGTKLSDEPNQDCEAAEYVFVYDLKSSTQTFKQVASMNVVRENPCVVSDEHFIYVLGGLTRSLDFDSETDTMERYDPESNSWVNLSPVGYCNISGSPEQCALANDKIFVIQGETINNDKKFNLVYDINTDAWSQISPPPLCAERGFLTHCQDKLYLICGGHTRAEQQDFKTSNIIKTVSYDLKEKVWSEVEHRLELNVRYSKYSTFVSREASISLAGTVVRLSKDFVSRLKLLEDIVPPST